MTSKPAENTIEDAAVAKFCAAAAHLLGDKGFSQEIERIEPWLTDWRKRYVGRAFAIAEPSGADELIDLVKLCAAHRIAIVPQGGNSGMVGGATPDASGRALLLSTRRMTLLSIDTDRSTATCEAGVVLQTLHEAAARHGLRFPLSLGGKGTATIGGLAATNAGGTQVLRHGTMRHQVLGLDAVLADGQFLAASTVMKKDNRGFDLKQLFIGSEGTLGVITQVIVHLAPAIAERRVVWCAVRDPHEARRLLLHCERQLGAALEGFEILPQACLDSVVAYLPKARPPLQDRSAWHALLEFVADSRSANDLGDRVEACLGSAMQQGLTGDAVIAANDVQAEAFWALREMIAPAEKASGRAVQHDIAVAPSAMPDMMASLAALIENDFPGHDVRAFGHLGDGNIHFHVVAPDTAPADWDGTTAKAISDRVYRTVASSGGTISAEHGIGQDKLAMLEKTHDATALDVMRRIKLALDPHNLLNPGKLVNLAPARGVA